MIVVEGKCNRIAVVYGVLSILGALLAIGGLAIRFIPIPDSLSDRALDDFNASKRFLGSPFFIAIWVLSALFAAYIWWRFRAALASVILDARGLFFPVLPGSRFGRLIPWDLCACVDRASGAEDERIPRLTRKMAAILFADSMLIFVYLNQPRRGTWSSNRFMKWMYQANDNACVAKFAGSERIILECIGVEGCSHQAMLRVVNAMIQNESLRRRYCDSSTLHAIVEAPVGQILLRSSSTGEDFLIVAAGRICSEPIAAA